MLFREEDKRIMKRLFSNSVHAQLSESNNKPIAEVEFLSLVIYDSAVLAEILWRRCDYEHATEYIQNGIECNIRIMERFREMKQNIKNDKRNNSKS